MDVKKTLFGTLGGGVVIFLLGYLFFGILLADFFAKNAGSAQGVMKDIPDFLPLILGDLVLGFLLTYIYGRWAGIKTFATGAKAGFVIGLTMVLGSNLIALGVSNLHTWTSAIADAVLVGIMVAIAGGVVGWILGMSD